MAQNERNSTRSRRRRASAVVTIHDVAARAGVSVATVSRVLNGKELVREETTREVLAAARHLRYVPNVAARTLSNRRSQTIGIVLPDVHGEFFSEVIRGIDVAARHEGYHILVSGSHSDAGEMLAVLDAMRGRVDGLVVMAPDVALTSLGESLAPLPVVLLNSSDESHDAITIDNFGGARAMMRHLAELGHERIAFIKGPAQNADARERLRGYRQAMRGRGGARRALEYEGDFTERSGYAAAALIADASPRPTAIFAANDSMAIGALSAMTERGISVPGRMSVVGFDDIPIAHYVAPPLTTIRVDIAELGRRAFALLRDAIQPLTAGPSPRSRGEGGRRPGEGRQECIGTTLVVRKSSASPEGQRKRGARKGDES